VILSLFSNAIFFLSKCELTHFIYILKFFNLLNNNLEQQAQAIYQQMFIDNASSNWTEGTLSDIADITMGQSSSGSSYNSPYPLQI